VRSVKHRERTLCIVHVKSHTIVADGECTVACALPSVDFDYGMRYAAGEFERMTGDSRTPTYECCGAVAVSQHARATHALHLLPQLQSDSPTELARSSVQLKRSAVR
jgi:hypothetical protein